MLKITRCVRFASNSTQFGPKSDISDFNCSALFWNGTNLLFHFFWRLVDKSFTKLFSHLFNVSVFWYDAWLQINYKTILFLLLLILKFWTVWIKLTKLKPKTFWSSNVCQPCSRCQSGLSDLGTNRARWSSNRTNLCPNLPSLQ